MKAVLCSYLRRFFVLWVFLFVIVSVTQAHPGHHDKDSDSCCPWARGVVRILAFLSVAQQVGTPVTAQEVPSYGALASSSCHPSLQEYHEIGRIHGGGHYPTYPCSELEYATRALRSDLNRFFHLMTLYLNESDPRGRQPHLQRDIPQICANLVKESCTRSEMGMALIECHAKDTAQKIQNYRPRDLILVEGSFCTLRDTMLPVPQYYNPLYRGDSFPQEWLHYHYLAPKKASDPTHYDPFRAFYKKGQ